MNDNHYSAEELATRPANPPAPEHPFFSITVYVLNDPTGEHAKRLLDLMPELRTAPGRVHGRTALLWSFEGKAAFESARETVLKADSGHYDMRTFSALLDA